MPPGRALLEPAGGACGCKSRNFWGVLAYQVIRSDFLGFLLVLPMPAFFSTLPPFADVLSQHGVKEKKLRTALSDYLELIEELLAETDPFGEAYAYLELSDRRQEVATFYALLLA